MGVWRSQRESKFGKPNGDVALSAATSESSNAPIKPR